MIKAFGAGRGAKKPAPPATDGGSGGAVAPPADGGKQPGEIRMQKEFDELDLPSMVRLVFPDPNNIMTFGLDVRPEEGYWRGATYSFTFTIPPL